MPTSPNLSTVLTNFGLTSLLSGRVLLVFLRHPGCIFTSTALTALGQQRAAIEELGVTICIVHLETDVSCALTQAAKFGLEGVGMIEDTDTDLYRAAGIGRGTNQQLIGPSVWWTGTKAFFTGHRQSKIKADVRQLAGLALLADGEILLNRPCADASEVPDYLALCRLAWAAG